MKVVLALACRAVGADLSRCATGGAPESDARTDRSKSKATLIDTLLADHAIFRLEADCDGST